MSKRVWKLQDFVAHTGRVHCARLGEKSGQVLASGGEDRRVNIWKVGKPHAMMSLTGHSSAVECLVFDKHEEVLVVGCGGGSLQIWNLEYRKMNGSLTGHRTACISVECHPYGEFFASGSADTNLKIWDTRRKSCIQTYRGHTASITSLRFSPHGRWIATGGQDHQVKLWDLTAGKLLKDLDLHRGPIECLAFHPKDYLLATGSADRTTKLWNLESFQMVSSTELGSAPVQAVKFYDEDKSVLSAAQDALRVYPVDSLASPLDALEADWKGVQDMRICAPEEKLLAISTEQSQLGIWVADLQKRDSARGVPPPPGTGYARFHGRANSQPSQARAQQTPMRRGSGGPPPGDTVRENSDDLDCGDFGPEQAGVEPLDAAPPPRLPLAHERSPVAQDRGGLPMGSPGAGAAGAAAAAGAPSPKFAAASPAGRMASPAHGDVGPTADRGGFGMNGRADRDLPGRGGSDRDLPARADRGGSGRGDRDLPDWRGAGVPGAASPKAMASQGCRQGPGIPPRTADERPLPSRMVADDRPPPSRMGADDRPPPSRMCADDRPPPSRSGADDRGGGGYGMPRDMPSPAVRAESVADQLSQMSAKHPQMKGVLSRRIEQVRKLKDLWAQGNLSGMQAVVHMSQDYAVFCDFLRVLMRNQLVGSMNLDGCLTLLPILREMMGSKYEEFITVAFQFVDLLKDHFGRLIEETRATCSHIPERQLDLAREERLRKCNACHEQFEEFRRLKRGR